MKFNKFLMGIMGALALSACSSEEGIPDKTPTGEGEPKFMSVTIRNANPNTRAGGDQTNINGNIFEEGYDSENNIKSLRFYFFDGNGNPVAIQINGRNYYEPESIDNNGKPDMDNTVEKVLNAFIVINSADNQIGTKIKKMVAVANHKAIAGKLGTENLSLAQLQAIIGDETELNVAADPATGFVMTSSSFVDADGNPACAAEISEANIRKSKEEALQFPVDVYVERAVAKVRVKANWDNTMSVRTGVKYGDKVYSAIALTSKLADGTTKKITVDNTETGAQVYAIFRNWDLWWTADRSYLFKKVDNWFSQLGDWWNHHSYHRSYWAENPADVKLNKHPHNFASKNILVSGDFTGANVATEAAYCLENAAKANNGGLMDTYNPDAATTPRTLVYLSALLVTVDEAGNATPLPLAEWASSRGTVASIKASMFKVNENVVYLRSKNAISSTSGSTTDPDGNILESGGVKYKLYPITVNDLHFVSGLQAGMANDQVENSPRYLSYLVLNDNLTRSENGTPVELDGKFYQKNSDGSYPELTLAEANDIFKSVGGAKIWNSGDTYYYHEINHLGIGETKGYYGVVRNHIYELELNNVYGLGTPVLTPEDGEDPGNWEDIIPQKPTNEFYLGARVNILSWRVVPNNVKLEW